jgi:hypothetical protein
MNRGGVERVREDERMVWNRGGVERVREDEWMGWWW